MLNFLRALRRTKASPVASKIQKTAIAHQQVTGEILDTAKTIQQTTKARQQISGEMLDKARTHQEIAQQIQRMSLQNQERHSKLLDKWEKQAQRFDDILMKWEQMK